MNKIIEDVKEYIRFIKSEYGLQITICDLCPTLYSCYNELIPYSNHHNPFCLFLKKNAHIQKSCIKNQLKIKEKCLTKNYFQGTCYTGMGEYIFSISHNGTYLGFISVGNFCFDKELTQARIRQLAEQYDLPYETLSRYYQASLNNTTFSLSKIKNLINPLQRMLELLYLSILNPSQKKDSVQDKLLNDILFYLNEHYMNNLVLDEIAKELNYSKSYLCHYFFQKRRMTIMFYVKNLRITQAKKLLREKNFSVTDIAFQVGFNDSNYFTNSFKKITGMSPLKYRKMKLEESPLSKTNSNVTN